MDTLSSCIYLVWLQGAVTYQLCNEALRWATVFREIESHRNQLGIVDYSVSQTTLEQVSSLIVVQAVGSFVPRLSPCEHTMHH